MLPAQRSIVHDTDKAASAPCEKCLEEKSDTTSLRAPPLSVKFFLDALAMERAAIAELFYNALIDLDELEKLDRFLSARVQLILSATRSRKPDPSGFQVLTKIHLLVYA